MYPISKKLAVEAVAAFKRAELPAMHAADAPKGHGFVMTAEKAETLARSSAAHPLTEFERSIEGSPLYAKQFPDKVADAKAAILGLGSHAMRAAD